MASKQYIRRNDKHNPLDAVLYSVSVESGVITSVAFFVLLLLCVVFWLHVVLDSPGFAAGVLAAEVHGHEDREAEGHGDGACESDVSWDETRY